MDHNKSRRDRWFREYTDIANNYFRLYPDSVFDICGWDSHEQDFLDGYTPEQAFYNDLSVDMPF